METRSTRSITRAILDAARRSPEAPALTVDGEHWSYGELLAAASALASALPQATEGEPQPITAVMAQRHCSSYIGILAALLRGNAYVPINVEHPDSRDLEVLRRSGAQRIICGDLVAERLASMLLQDPALSANVEIVPCADHKTASSTTGEPAEFAAFEPPASALAYILFTSGSTGEPKGVPITLGNVTSYLDGVASIMDVTPEDRFSQTFELTFDPSVHDLFVCWTNGAHLIVPDPRDLADPAQYIREQAITCWFSVPSLAQQVLRRGHLEENALPSLRWSLFAGEALPANLARAWAAAAPASRVENWYGPTEATIVCAHFALPEGETWDQQHDIVPIGKAFPRMDLTICDEDLLAVADGTPGELFLRGPQVAGGYLVDPEKTAQSFVGLPGRDGVFYRTGDRVVREADGNVRFLGRVDTQVKIRGHRVELGAIETEVRSTIEGREVVAMSWPPGELSGTSVIVALESAPIDVQAIIEALRVKLPEYMVPSRILCVPEFPTNVSGKIDRKALAVRTAEMLQRDADEVDITGLPPLPAQLMEAILLISPNLSVSRIMRADSLLAAGMDSLSFVSLTAEIERLYGLDLDQEDVVDLAEMSFGEIVETVGEARPQRGLVASVKARLRRQLTRSSPPAAEGVAISPRANRTVQFVERFPEVLRTSDTPPMLAVGSSGIYRAFVPETFDEAARGAGAQVHSLNVGLPALSCASMTLVCGTIRDRCEALGVRIPLIVYELDPMYISRLRPNIELELGPEYVSGEISSSEEDTVDKDFTWPISSAGFVRPDARSVQRGQQPLWEIKRDYEVARTYLGDLPFDETAIAAWIAGAKVLSTVTDRVVGFVHPLNPKAIDGVLDRERGPGFATIVGEIEERSGVVLIPWETFELEDSDFLDINHVNAGSGAQKISVQLAARCFRARAPS